MKRFSTLLFIASLLCMNTCNDAENEAKDSREQSKECITVDLFPTPAKEKATPIITRSTNSLDEPISFSVRNNSERDFRYYGKGMYGEETLQACVIRLYKDGEQVPYNGPRVELPGFFKEHIRTLRPGNCISYKVRLNAFGDRRAPKPLPPGRYALRIEGSFPGDYPNKHHCTPFQLDESIAFIDVQ